MSYNVTGILLAGGKSSRMGKDKALIKYGDETFMSNSLKKLNKLFDEVIVVADNVEKYHIENVKIIKDIYPGMGPMGGIHAALKAAKNDWLFVIPCDMPMWEVFLVEEMLKHRLDNDIVVPLINDHMEPLFALYKKTCIPGIEQCLNNNIIKVIELYSLVKTNYLDLEKLYHEFNQCTKSFFNINTPEDLYNMVKINGLKTNVEIEQALKLLLSKTKVTNKTEIIHINNSLGRVLSENIYAPQNLPESQRSSVDGYIICDEDINDVMLNGFLKLAVTDKVPAGSIPVNSLSRGNSQSVMTGAVLPLNSAGVIMHEHVERENSSIIVRGNIKKGQNIIEAGSDVKKGDIVASKGEIISPELLSILSFNGISFIPVYWVIKASIISTGSELILPGEKYNTAKTYNSNMYFADSILKNLGVETVMGGIAPDNAAKLSEKLSEAMKESDIVISFGGAFSGEYDLIEQSLLMLGAKILFSGIAVKPGKSFIAAKKDEKLFLCLSGSPGSAFNNVHLVVKPVIKKLMGISNFMPAKLEIKIPDDYANKKSYRRILQGRLHLEKGELQFKIFEGKSIFDVLKKTNILIDLPSKAYFKADDLINVYYIEED
ncbi:NTP transferase domain-containing protein [Sedimentibacter sp. MB31-C6]|uniref:NTP transferase domain-containing protein n=1 Tax=Sedimentibacter sp. MB31-C6 TaxID=3109366 RepID=UPI002DDD9E17|nr:NTP transferase domain-containing protein [Sedimentibacter sp. MB36-C1]WSI04452.1 NTP transferase domain-containing protein [Sedimentibacter sp. MB36-C1]